MQNIIVTIGYAEAELAGRARTLYYWLSFSRPVGRVSILEGIATMMTPITYLEWALFLRFCLADLFCEVLF